MRYFLIIILLSFINCKSVKILNAKKEVHMPGHKRGGSYIVYSLALKAEKYFTIKQILLENNTKPLKYYYKDSKGKSSYNMLTPFPKGNYSFHFKNKEVDNLSNKEYLIIEYFLEDKLIKQKVFVEELGKQRIQK